MKDTPPGIEKKFRKMLLERSGEERLKMGCSMHATAQALVIASIPEKDAVAVKRELFLRFYGAEFEPKRRKRILRALRKATKSLEKRAKTRVVFGPARATKEMRVAERSELYGAKEIPLWLRRLGIVKAEMKTVRFPRTAQEGFRQCAELSATARRWFRQSIRAEHPGASEEEIENERRLLLARLCAAQTRQRAKWKRELDRYFRS